MRCEPVSIYGTVERLRDASLPLAHYLDELCDRIERGEPEISALLSEPDRRGRLQRDAANLLAHYPDPAQRPPLFGIPVGVKDIIRVDGFATGAGSQLPPDVFAGPEATCVTQLKRAGALILGKTVTTEFAYVEPGPTRNPRNPDHTPGGSSSGSAAAVAAGYCPLSLGTQTVGSVIRPAAFCGVVGFKPSFGLAPLGGVIPFAPSVDHLGFMVQDARDLWPALAVLCGPPEASAVRSARLGIPSGPYFDQASEAARTVFEASVAQLQSAGWQIERLRVLDDIEAISHRHQRLIAAEMAQSHLAWFADYENLYRPRTADLIRTGLEVSPNELAQARRGREALRQALHAAMDAGGIDAWICPSATGPAPMGIESTGQPWMQRPWTHAGLPAATFPAGAIGELPLGMQVVGRYDADAPLAALTAELAQDLRRAA